MSGFLGSPTSRTQHVASSLGVRGLGWLSVLVSRLASWLAQQAELRQLFAVQGLGLWGLGFRVER